MAHPSTIQLQEAMFQSERIRDLELARNEVRDCSPELPETVRNERVANLEALIRSEVATLEAKVRRIRNRNYVTVTNYQEFDFLIECTNSNVGVRISHGTSPGEIDYIRNHAGSRAVIIEQAPGA